MRFCCLFAAVCLAAGMPLHAQTKDAPATALSAEEAAEGFVPIFNGKTLEEMVNERVGA